MLFNILSAILVWIALFYLFLFIFNRGNITPEDADESDKTAGVAGTIGTLIFMWVMSWQNWWR